MLFARLPILLENSLPAEVCGNPVPMLHDWDGDGDLCVMTPKRKWKGRVNT